jgi:hypothetical protein
LLCFFESHLTGIKNVSENFFFHHFLRLKKTQN